MQPNLSSERPVSTQTPKPSNAILGSFRYRNSNLDFANDFPYTDSVLEVARDGEKTGAITLSEKISKCHTQKAFYKCPNCNRYFAVFMTCKSRLCPRCARTRAMDWVHKFISFEPHLKLKIKFQYPMVLNLTSLLVQDLESGINLILNSFRSLRRRFPEMKKGVYSIEFVPKVGGYWYIHLHSYLDCIWLDGEKVSKVWKSLIGADVKYIRRRCGIGSLVETIKYITKGLENLTDDQRETIDCAIKHRRLVNVWGFRVSSLVHTEELSLICPDCKCKLSYIGKGFKILQEWELFNILGCTMLPINTS